MTEQNTQSQVQTEDAGLVVVDPFEGDDTEATSYVKLEDRRAEAVSIARELLADDADSATPEQGILALRGAGHEFYRTMKSSPRQVRKFGRDFKAAQPQTESKSARVSKAAEITDDLAAVRALLSEIRKSTDPESVKTQLEGVKAGVDTMLGKLA